MKLFILACAVGLILTVVGCDVPDRVSRLEKENQETKAEMERLRTARSATADYDLQAKCSRDSKVFFNEGWRRDKDTILLDYSNHYNKSLNKCFISVEFHYSIKGIVSWGNDISLWDVYENSKYGSFFESHYQLNANSERINTITTCEVVDKKCKTIDEYRALIQPYLNN
jgi:hypothetical protein